MNLDYLRYFVKLAEIQHYTRAAEQLCISQPSLSHAIRQLETELGVPLFEKTGRNTTLTRFGADFLSCAQRTLSTLDDGVTALQKSARGEGFIRLGFLRVLGISYIPQLAAQFLAANPNRQIQFDFHSDRTQALLDGLSEQMYDLVFCSKPAPEMHMTAVPVTQQDLVLIVPPNHPLSHLHSIDLSEALPYPMIYFAKGSGLREVVDDLFASFGAAPHIALETEEDQVIAGLVAQGFGIAVVPYMDLLLKLDLCILKISAPPYKREFFMVHNTDVFLPPVVEDFRQFVLTHGRNSADHTKHL